MLPSVPAVLLIGLIIGFVLGAAAHAKHMEDQASKYAIHAAAREGQSKRCLPFIRK